MLMHAVLPKVGCHLWSLAASSLGLRFGAWNADPLGDWESAFEMNQPLKCW